MFHTSDLQGIIYNENQTKQEQHVIMLLLVKPQDRNAGDYINNFNYWDKDSNMYCNIYVPGFLTESVDIYDDIIEVNSAGWRKLFYSDACFCTVKDQLSNRLENWRYSGSPELIILQNNPAHSDERILCFSNYIYIDIEYGVKEGYIDTVPRFMERLISASKKEVDAKQLIRREYHSRLAPEKVICSALNECEVLPKTVRKILKDRAFLRTKRTK